MSNRPFRRLRRPAAAVAAVAALALSATTLAAPGAEAEPDNVLVDGLLAPLSLAVSGEDVYYSSGGFAPGNPYTISQVGVEEPLVTSDKELGALSVDGDNLIYLKGTRIMSRTPEGVETKLADMKAYEKANNPDGSVRYGLGKVSQRCLKQWPKDIPAKYAGIVESHPYATTVVDGTVYVADAAANAILSIDEGGVSVVKVLKPVGVTLTKKFARMMGVKLPDCVLGKTYKFESVPTDVEVGEDGRLYVSKLPGGEVPGKGAVVSIPMAGGAEALEMGGLSGATGLALDGTDLYAANLFGAGISLNSAGNVFDQVPLSAALEVEGDMLYATTNVLPMGEDEPPNGMVVSYDLAEATP